MYTRQHFTEFWVNETGDAVTSPFKVFEGWCSVFDTVPFEASQGWTAVGQNDQAFSQADQYLSALGVPQDGGYYIVSPAFWSTQGTVPGGVNPMLPRAGYSDCLKDVPVRAVMDDTGLAPGYDALSNPKCFGNGPAGQGFEAGGYDASGTGWHWYSKQANSPVGLTKDYASSMGRDALSRGGQTSTTRAKILYSYIYGVAATNVDCIGLAQGPNGKDRYRAGFFNSTPYLVKDAVLRAYVVQNGKCTLAATTTTQIGPAPVGDGRGGVMSPAGVPSYGPGVKPGATPNSVVWEFEVSPPSGEYELRVTINMQYSENGLPLFEPLSTATAYGSFGALAPPLTGQKMEKAPSLPYKGPNPYDDNWASLSMQGLPPGGGGSGGGGGGGEGNLAALSVSADLSGTATAEFSSTFSIGGWATVRFYREDKTGAVQKVGDDQYVHFSPGGRVTVTQYNLGFRDGDTVWAAVDMAHSNGQWAAQEFSGDDGKSHPETTYADNLISGPVGQNQFTPLTYELHPSSYPVYERVAVYRTVTEKVWVGEVKRVPVEVEPPSNKKRVRLVE